MMVRLYLVMDVVINVAKKKAGNALRLMLSQEEHHFAPKFLNAAMVLRKFSNNVMMAQYLVVTDAKFAKFKTDGNAINLDAI